MLPQRKIKNPVENVSQMNKATSPVTVALWGSRVQISAAPPFSALLYRAEMVLRVLAQNLRANFRANFFHSGQISPRQQGVNDLVQVGVDVVRHANTMSPC